MTRILGVDFSGASDAGRKIWVAEGRQDATGAFALATCVAAVDLPGGGRTPAEAVPALARHIAALGEARVGCDFPFSLPRDLVTARSWRSFALRYAAEFADADSFRSIMRSRHNAIEHKRMTDRIAGTPFNSYNLRLYRQTWWGITGVVGPLVRAGRAIVRPQQKLHAGKPTLIEVCAACTLKSIDLYPPYKGKEAIHRKARQRILDHLIDRGALAAPARSMRRLLLDNEGGDALDAVIGAVAAARADLAKEPDAFQRLEGRVYYEIGV
ncbi:MAG TPA: hypothetical protein VJ790_18370 [Dongiaceae bacterium]|nr:hypothetical protein [Dongiaceae bacterium]